MFLKSLKAEPKKCVVNIGFAGEIIIGGRCTHVHAPGKILHREGNHAILSFSLDGQAPRNWVAAYTYDPDLLSIGNHNYSFGAEGVDPTGGSGFNVSEYLPTLYDGFVLFRPWGLVGRLGEDWIDIEDTTIRPDQPIRFMVGWTADGIYQDALNKLDALQPKAYLDGDEFLLFRHEVFPFSSSIDWQQYIFSFTW